MTIDALEDDIAIPEGLTRQERRKLEREREKLKKSLENLPFGIDWAKVSPIDRKSIPGESLSKSGKFISIFGRCEGFTYYSKNNRKQKGSESGKKGISEGIFSLKTALRPKRKNPTIDSDVVNMLAIRVRQHNATVSNTSHKTNLRDVKVVYLRGLSVGDKKTALKRVNNFFQAMASNTPLPKGQRQDIDIVPETHPSKDKKTAHKDGGFDDGEFGIKYKSACCPQLVKRHKRL